MIPATIAPAAPSAPAAASPALPPGVTARATLEDPLPEALTGRSHGPLTRYRRWPVFSRRWIAGRWATVSLWLAVGLLPVLLATLANPPATRPWGGLLMATLELLVPMLLGPWLGWQVRRRGWAPAREWAGLCAAVALAVSAATAMHYWGGEPVKHWVAEQLGQLDAQGQRPRVALRVGVQVGTQPDREPGKKQPEVDTSIHVVNYIARGTLAFLLAGGLGLFGWRRERAGLAALARERELAQAQAARREAELRLSVLAAQVEPHFLFNTLAGVRSAIGTDPVRASEMIDRLVDYLRASIPRLRSDGSAQATLGGQFDSVRAYLGLMAARMPRLAWEVHAPAELLAARTPPLMLISLVENAVKHGVEPKIGPARIEVRATRGEGGRLQVTVADDGVGFGAAAGSAGSGIGLANIRERLAHLYGAQAALTLQARPEGGVAATLSLPLEWPAGCTAAAAP